MSNWKLRLYKHILQWLIDGLTATVYSKEIPSEKERFNVSALEDAYWGLQDALEALEDIKPQVKTKVFIFRTL